MKRIININLAGVVIPIEDSAYDTLQRYIESLRRYFATEDGRDEIINDIESRMAELMADRLKKGTACISDADVSEIISAMGRIEDFEAADADDASTTSGFTSAGAKTRPRGRLHRDANDKFLGGVCSGIAAYTNVDPTVVRLLFAIISFGAFGFGFLAYIALWIFLPVSTVESYTGKRFFRNPDDQMLGGVCGGLAAYFGKNANNIRLLFAAPLMLNVFITIINTVFSHAENFGVVEFAFGSFTGTFIIAYVVLWIVLPLARSPYDKMEMRGEKVDVGRIRQNVQEGMGDFKGRARDFGEEVRTAATNLTSRVNTFSSQLGKDFNKDFNSAARPAMTGLGHAVGTLFRVFFLMVAGIIAFSLFIGVLVLTLGGAMGPINNFLLEGTGEVLLLWGVLIFFLAVPLIAIITLIIRRLMKVRSQNKYLGWTFGGLWSLGWICLPFFVSSLFNDVRTSETTETPIALARPLAARLVVQAPEPAIRYGGNFSWLHVDNDDAGWDLTDDSLLLSNVFINVKKSPDSLYHVTLQRYSTGRNRNLALSRAGKIEYSVASVDSFLRLGSGFGVSKAEKFRGQKVIVELSVPVGKLIRFDESVGEKLNPFDIRVSNSGNNGRRRWGGRNSRHIEFDFSNYFDWEPDTDYIMNPDGNVVKLVSGQAVPVLPPAAPATPAAPARITTGEGETDDESEDSNNDGAWLPAAGITVKQQAKVQPTPSPLPWIPTIF